VDQLGGKRGKEFVEKIHDKLSGYGKHSVNPSGMEKMVDGPTGRYRIA
jgi:hypothetical protein